MKRTESVDEDDSAQSSKRVKNQDVTEESVEVPEEPVLPDSIVEPMITDSPSHEAKDVDLPKAVESTDVEEKNVSETKVEDNGIVDA